MSCLPSSGGCERRRTDPFVAHLNDEERTSFRHERCLDRELRNTPQPEALYIDPQTDERLVVERKTLVWPTDYVERHRSYHVVAERVCAELAPITNDRPYKLILEDGFRRSSRELTSFADQIVLSIRRDFHKLSRGRTLGDSRRGLSWRFRREESGARDAAREPPSGVIVRSFPRETLDFQGRAPTEFLQQCKKVLDSCGKKFAGYSECRRTLVLEGQGEIEWIPAGWLAEVLIEVGIPDPNWQIWTGTFDWITDWEQDWVFERVIPA